MQLSCLQGSVWFVQPHSRTSPSPRASTLAKLQAGRSLWFFSVAFSSSYLSARQDKTRQDDDDDTYLSIYHHCSLLSW